MSLFGAVADSYVASAPPAGWAATVAALSPTAWYRLGESSGTTMVDSSGNGHDGTYTDVTLGASSLVAGDSDTAATFGSLTSKGLVDYASWLDVTTAVSVLIIGKTSAGNVQSMIDRDDTATGRCFQFRLNAGKLEFIKVGGTGGTVTAASTATYNDGSAHDFGATYDGSNIRLYVDGVKIKTTSAAGSLATPSAGGLAIGHQDKITTNTQTFVGVLDEAIYKAGAVWSDSDFANLHAARV